MPQNQLKSSSTSQASGCTSKTFLCEHHRRQLQEHPKAAVLSWSDWVQEGAAAYQQGLLKKATTYFGCAFELAEQLVAQFTAHGQADGMRHIDRLLSAGEGLLDCLQRGDMPELQREYLLLMHNHLLHEQMRTPLMMAEIEDEMVASIRRLNSELPPLPAHYLPVRFHAARLH